MKSTAISLLLLTQQTQSINLRRGDVFSKSDNVYSNLFAANDATVIFQSQESELPHLTSPPRFKNTPPSSAASQDLIAGANSIGIPAAPSTATIPACIECENEKAKLNLNPALPVGPYFSNKNAVFNPKWGSHGHWKWLHHAGDGDLHHTTLLKTGHTIERADNYGQADPYEKNMWNVKATMTLMAEDVPDIVSLSAAIAAIANVDRRYVSIRSVHRDMSGGIDSGVSGPQVVDYNTEVETSTSTATGSIDATDTATEAIVKVAADTATTAETATMAETATTATGSAGTVDPSETLSEVKPVIEKVETIETIEKVSDVTSHLSPAQKMIGGVVETAVDAAKNDIGSLMPKIEGEIEKQEKDLEEKLEKAEQSLTKDQTVHENPEQEIATIGESLDNLQREVGNNVTNPSDGMPTTSLVEERVLQTTAVAPIVGQCVALENVPGCKGIGKQYRASASPFVNDKYETFKLTVTAASPFGPILEPAMGGCSLPSILEHACLVLFPPCDATCTPRKASIMSCVDFNDRKCLTEKVIAGLRPQAAMAQGMFLIYLCSLISYSFSFL